MAKANESRSTERPLWLTWPAAWWLAPQLEARCSACQGRIILNEKGEVVFCADCQVRAHDDIAASELGGGD